MAEASTPIEIFCSYAPADEMWLRKMETHLSGLVRQGLVSLWHDRLLVAGTDWASTIDTHLSTASIILLLVSADFLASDYCFGIEMERALEREAAGEARVIPILVRPVDWRDAPFAHLQPLPTDTKPLAIWENQEMALADVASGIRRVIEDMPLLSASAPRAALPTIWNIPYPRNPFFLGREVELAQVRHCLHANQAAALSQPQAISGLGGIGKTQLALEYAYRYSQDYQAVLWGRAESREALMASYITFATLLRLLEHETKEQEIIVQAVKSWLQIHRDWLLILDNADELMQLPDFLPPSLGGHVLLTTRAGATGRLAHRLEIETLKPAQGALFLLRRAALIAPDAQLSQAFGEEQELALQISKELGGLPLALDQAGAYLEEADMDLTSYWSIYQQHRADLLQRRGGLVADHPSPVATTWSLSFQRVEEKNPAAADLLRFCAFLSPDAIPQEILTTGAPLLGPQLAPVAGDAFLLSQAIEALRAYSLVRRDPRRKVLSIHRLVQAVLQNTLSEEESRVWAKRAMLAVHAAFPSVEHGTWQQCERHLPQALTAEQLIERYQFFDEEAGRLIYEVARYLHEVARYSEAELLYQRAIRIFEQQLGSGHSQVAYPLTSLAILYHDQGKYGQGESLFQRALGIFEQQLGVDHPDVARPLTNLATLYRYQGRYQQGELLFQRAITIREQQLGPEHLQVAYSLTGLAHLYREQGKYSKAEPLYQRALAIREQQLGPEHLQVAYSLTGLAYLYGEQGKYAEAETLYQRAIRIFEQQLGSEHPRVAYPLTGLATLCREQGKYAQAETLYQRALQIREQQLGSEHPQMAYPLHGLAILYSEQGKYIEAEPLFLHALHIREQALELGHPETAETMHDLAQLREAQGNNEEARIWYARALAIREPTLGVHHPKTTETRKRFITLLRVMGLHEEAAQVEATPSKL